MHAAHVKGDGRELAGGGGRGGGGRGGGGGSRTIRVHGAARGGAPRGARVRPVCRRITTSVVAALPPAPPHRATPQLAFETLPLCGHLRQELVNIRVEPSHKGGDGVFKPLDGPVCGARLGQELRHEEERIDGVLQDGAIGPQLLRERGCVQQVDGGQRVGSGARGGRYDGITRIDHLCVIVRRSGRPVPPRQRQPAAATIAGFGRGEPRRPCLLFSV